MKIEINWINHVCKNLNDSVAETYEALADQDYDEALSSLNRLEEIIKEIKDEIKTN